ncbi:hypothetical protein ACLB2K_005313 [Fragaria x ananassa]
MVGDAAGVCSGGDAPSSEPNSGERKNLRTLRGMSLPDKGLPTALIEDTFDDGIRWTTQEGLGLNLSRKLLCRMNGRVQYIREHDKCYFLIDIELRTRKEMQMLLLTQADKNASP